MYGFPRPLIPNGMQCNSHRAPYNSQWRPFHGSWGPFLPRDQSFSNHRIPMHRGSEEHWCETCDRGFPSEDLLSKHKQQHQVGTKTHTRQLYSSTYLLGKTRPRSGLPYVIANLIELFKKCNHIIDTIYTTYHIFI